MLRDRPAPRRCSLICIRPVRRRCPRATVPPPRADVVGRWRPHRTPISSRRSPTTPRGRSGSERLGSTLALRPQARAQPIDRRAPDERVPREDRGTRADGGRVEAAGRRSRQPLAGLPCRRGGRSVDAGGGAVWHGHETRRTRKHPAVGVAKRETVTQRDTKRSETATERRELACPECGCAHLPVLYTRRRNGCMKRVREGHHCGRRIVTRERL